MMLENSLVPGVCVTSGISLTVVSKELLIQNARSSLIESICHPDRANPPTNFLGLT